MRRRPFSPACTATHGTFDVLFEIEMIPHDFIDYFKWT